MPTLAERLKTLVDWWPLVLLLQQVAMAPPGKSQAAAVLQVLRFLAGKTETEIDDRLADHIQRVIATPEGGELVEYVLTLASRRGGV